MSNLTELLTQQLHLLENLKVQLEQELHLISSRDAEALTKLVNEKEQTLDQVIEQDEKIKQAYHGLNAQALSESDNALFDKINALLEQCKFRTEINSKAVEQGQLRLEHLRNLLLEARSKESMTYDKSGKPQIGKGGKGVSA